MIDPNAITALFAVPLMCLVLRGLLPFWSRERQPDDLHHFSLGLSWVVGVFMLRTFYWGAVRSFVIWLDPDLWLHWSEIVRGPDWINAAFNIGLCIGSLHILRAFRAMIPPEYRDDWPLFKAPFYPDGWCFRKASGGFRDIWKRTK